MFRRITLSLFALGFLAAAANAAPMTPAVAPTQTAAATETVHVMTSRSAGHYHGHFHHHMHHSWHRHWHHRYQGGITTVTGTIAGIADPGEISENGAAGSTGRALFHNAEPINSFYKQPMLSGG